MPADVCEYIDGITHRFTRHDVARVSDPGNFYFGRLVMVTALHASDIYTVRVLRPNGLSSIEFVCHRDDLEEVAQ